MARKIRENVFFINATDWNRRLFDSLIPLPDGTSYNAYLIKGSEKTVLIDAVDPALADILFEQLQDVERLDYIVSLHSEQDHSGSIPAVLEKYPDATVLTSAKGKDQLVRHLLLEEEKITIVGDGEELSLGDKTLQFI